MYRPKVVALEGVSGSGKTALIHPVNQLNDYRDYVMMRFTPSMWVYNKVFGREEIDYEHISRAMQDVADLHLVWLQVAPEEALRRKAAKGDDDYIEDVYVADLWFEFYFDYVTAIEQVHRVDTTGRTETEVLREIEQRIYGEGT